MVDRPRFRAAEGRAGGLRGDPAVRTAAVAITHGLDPIALLALGRDDYAIAVAALASAEQLRAARDSAFIKALSEHTAQRTIRALVRSLRS